MKFSFKFLCNSSPHWMRQLSNRGLKSFRFLYHPLKSFRFLYNPLNSFKYSLRNSRRRLLLPAAGLLLALIPILLYSTFFAPPKASADSLLSFNEGYGTTVNDSEGTASGTINGPDWKTEDLCKSGKCLYFNGSSDYVEIEDTDDSLDADGDFTLMAWVRLTSDTAGYKNIITKGDSSSSYNYYIDIDGDEHLEAGYYGGVGSGVSNTALTLNRWHHVAVVHDDSADTIYYYIDGQSSSSRSFDATSPTINNDSLDIGAFETSTGVYDEFFPGFIDEVKILPTTALSADQIKTESLGSTPDRGTSASFGGGDESYLSDGLVGYWKMEEATADTCGGGNDTCDSSGNGNDGAWVNQATSAAGKYGNGVIFDGTSDGIALGDAVNISGAEGITIASWFYTNAYDDETIISRSYTSAGANRAYYLGTDYGGQIVFSITTTGTGSSSQAEWETGIDATEDVWQHISTTYDSSDHTARLYINGILQASNSSITTGVMADGADNAEIGCWEDGCIASGVNGKIDELRLYKRALSPAEVASLYKWAPGPVGYWKMDENTGTMTNDSSGNNYNTSSFTSDPIWTKGKYGSALEFDSNDKAIASGFPWPADGGPVTVDFWMKLNTVDSGNTYLFRVGSSGTPNEFSFAPWGGTIYWDYGTNSGDGRISISYSGYFDKWTHVALVSEGNGGSFKAIYLDGNLVTSGSVSDGPDIAKTGITFNQDNFIGTVDDFKIYNYIRTQEQIISDMNAGHPAPGSPVGSPVGYWKFNEGYGDTANDSSPQGNNGNLGGSGQSCPTPGDTSTTCPAWTSSGRLGKALDFETSGTTDDYIEVPDSDSLDLTDELTLSVWIKPETLAETYYGIIRKGDSAANESNYHISLYGSVVIFGMYSGGGWRGTGTTNTSLQVDNWYHILVTYKDSTDDIDIYVNSVLQADDSGAETYSLSTNANPLYIGASDTDDEFFDGIIDEVKIYNFALSADQVAIEYNQGKAAVFGALGTDSNDNASWSAADSYCPPGQGTACTAPIAEWKFDENTGGYAYDTSNNNYTSTLSGSTSWSPGKIGRSLEFNGSDTYGEMSTSLPGLGTAFTISGWVYYDDISNFGQIITEWEYSNHDYNVGTNSSVIDCAITYTGNEDDRVYAQGPTAVTLSTWHHFTCVKTTSTLTMYMDGIPGTPTSTSGSVYDNGSINPTFGRRMDGAFPLDGKLDDIKIYNYARTPAQIAWDYNRGGPVGWWKFNESSWTNDCSTPDVYDSSAHANHGTTCPNADGPDTAVTGKFNNAMSFDGSNDYFKTNATATDLGFTNATSPFSLSLWLKTTSSGEVYLVDNYHSSYTQNISLRLDGGKVETWIRDASSNNNSNPQYGSGYNDNSWHHIVFTWDGGGNEYMYADGHQIGNTSSPSIVGSLNTSNGFFVASRDGAGSSVNGLIDDVRIYNYALTQQQINDIYNYGAVHF